MRERHRSLLGQKKCTFFVGLTRAFRACMNSKVMVENAHSSASRRGRRAAKALWLGVPSKASFDFLRSDLT